MDISIVRESARDTSSPGYRYRKGFSGKDNDSQDMQSIKISGKNSFSIEKAVLPKMRTNLDAFLSLSSATYSGMQVQSHWWGRM